MQVATSHVTVGQPICLWILLLGCLFACLHWHLLSDYISNSPVMARQLLAGWDCSRARLWPCLSWPPPSGKEWGREGSFELGLRPCFGSSPGPSIQKSPAFSFHPGPDFHSLYVGGQQQESGLPFYLQESPKVPHRLLDGALPRGDRVHGAGLSSQLEAAQLHEKAKIYRAFFPYCVPKVLLAITDGQEGMNGSRGVH